MHFHYLCSQIGKKVLEENKNMKQQHSPIELGTEPIGRLLLKYALPAIIAMTASSLYNNVDRIFIGQGVGPDAISGLATTFPFMNLSAAFGAMIGVGASAIISIRLGQKDYKSAQRVLGNSVVFNIIMGLLFTACTLPFLDQILMLFGASENTLPYARDYMEVIILGNLLTHLYFGMNAVLRAAGHPREAMYCTILTVVVNTILDPIFIYALHMGIRGAAIATIISQSVSLVWQFAIFCNPREALHLQRGIYRPSLRIARQILSIGASPFLMNCCACLVVLIINSQMRTYGDMLGVAKGGDMAIAAYGITNSIVFFFLMTVMGFNQGMQPIVGYNWGARQNERVWRCLKITMICATIVTSVGCAICELFPEVLTHFFTNDETITMLAARGFRVSSVMLPVVGAQMVIGNFFQSIGHAGKSIFLSVTRQLLFLIPFLFVLPRFFELDGVWMALPSSDAVSCIAAFSMLWWLTRKVKKGLA